MFVDSHRPERAVLLCFWVSPSCVCVGIRGVAKLLLDTPAEDLHITTKKVKELLTPELESVSADGRCPPRLWVLFDMARRFGNCDVQLCESVNSMVSFQTKRARNMTLPLLDSRVKIKKELGMGSRSSPVRWSAKRPYAEALLRKCIDHLPYADLVLSDVGRWATRPEPDALVQVDGCKLVSMFP